MSFINPALLLGALLFSVPLIIHLLNRQRYKRREWAAMEFLLLAFKKQRRRLRTENLLLLLLRCLIPIILALAIARPLVRETLGAAALGGSTHHVLVLDQSYSMGLRPDGSQSPHARMKELAGRLLETLESSSGSKVTVVEGGVRTSIPIDDELNLARVKAAVASLGGPQDSATDLTDALGQVAELVENATDPDTIVYLFTDMQVRAFGELEAPPRDDRVGAVPTDPDAELFDDTARDYLDRIQQLAEVVVLDVGGLANDATPSRADNLQIVDLELDTLVAVARNPMTVVATLRNRSGTSIETQVTLEVDGDQPTRRDIRLAAGAEGQVDFNVAFREKGMRRLRVSAEGDGLAADNNRYLVVPVRDRIRILVVEGTTETDPGLMESELLRALLDPTDGDGSPDLTVFEPVVIDTVEFLNGREDPRKFDVVALANIERLNDRAGSAIREAMLAGTGLLVMLGDQTDEASFNLHLHSVGDGPMPFRLIGPDGYQPGGDKYHESILEVPEHPVFRGFGSDVYREAFQASPVYRFIAARDLDPDRAQVVSRLRDTDRSPLMVVSSFGTGKSLFVTSPITQRPGRWNRLEHIMLALPLFHETARWLALPTTDTFNVMAGAKLTAMLRQRPIDVAVLLPERAGGGKRLVGETSRTLPGGLFSLPSFHETEYAGFYTVEMLLESAGSQRPHQEHFAANPDPDEGDLRYLSHRAAREQLGVKTVMRHLPSDSSGPIQGGRSDLGLPLLYLVLALVMSEAMLARFVSRRRAG